MKGYVHSIQSLGAVDGPGVRSVVFMQGCALRCAYCHNPDTWEIVADGAGNLLDAANNLADVTICGQTKCQPQEYTPEELVKKLLRFKPYFEEEGGVTISGGEPLLQAKFVAEVFRLLQEHGIHTALDTAGQITGEHVKEVLKYTDLALVDLKFLTEQEYHDHAKGSRAKVDEFLRLTREMQVPVWIRHVMVPGLTADAAYLRQIKQQAKALPNLEKIEWLPFHNLCKEKYEKMNLTFPLADTRVMEDAEVEGLLKEL